MSDAPEVPGAPWWRHGLVWMVIAGPASVALAGAVTVWLAVSFPDPVLPQRVGTQSMGAQADKSLLPALQGRNHAATPPAGR
ncbi:nitrogen fixation protein FixH [uncultured Ramlibacter sp.]|uniref:nitrogen fixation protein FixH n=1 Tax=uncultured Ramlibacter sp. TaxID=260755 RepID=UPI002634DC14|nr:nitrogen fixation protein FixH [uncultured Ramlibacter sp.]